MSTDLPNPPLRFDPSFETIAPDEAATIQAIVDTMRLGMNRGLAWPESSNVFWLMDRTLC